MAVCFFFVQFDGFNLNREHFVNVLSATAAIFVKRCCRLEDAYSAIGYFVNKKKIVLEDSHCIVTSARPWDERPGLTFNDFFLRNVFPTTFSPTHCILCHVRVSYFSFSSDCVKWSDHSNGTRWDSLIWMQKCNRHIKHIKSRSPRNEETIQLRAIAT